MDTSTENNSNSENNICNNNQLMKKCAYAIYKGINPDTKATVVKQDLLNLLEELNEPTDVNGNMTETQIKEEMLLKMNSCNFYKFLDNKFFIELYFSRSNLGTVATSNDKKVYNGLKNFFNLDKFSDITNTIKDTLDNNKLNTTIEKTQNILKNTKSSITVEYLYNLINNSELCYVDIVRQINNNIDQVDRFNYNSDSNSRDIYLVLTLYLYHLASLKNIKIDAELNDINRNSGINFENMNNSFSQTPASLDARQLITVNRFTKFRKQCDKACFLFHGVGTGKTFTSLTIALSHLDNDNKFTKGQPDDDKTPLNVLVICPQGLFFGAFADDAVKLGMYIYGKTIYQKNEDYTFEKFEACVKIDENSYYKILFTGFDYLNLFKENGLQQITDTYDVLICDEAHKIITEKLQPESKTTYEINYGKIDDNNQPQIVGDTYTQDETTTVVTIKDTRFLDFIKKIKKQAIFLTGTPIQKSPEDIVLILKFLNTKGVNDSNNAKLCQDVLKEAPSNSNFYFNRFDATSNPLHNSLINGTLADSFLVCQSLSGSVIEDLEKELQKKTPGFNLEDYLGVGKLIKQGKEQLKKLTDSEYAKIITDIIINNKENITNMTDDYIKDNLIPLIISKVDKKLEERGIDADEINKLIQNLNTILTPANIRRAKELLDNPTQNTQDMILNQFNQSLSQINTLSSQPSSQTSTASTSGEQLGGPSSVSTNSADTNTSITSADTNTPISSADTNTADTNTADTNTTDTNKIANMSEVSTENILPKGKKRIRKQTRRFSSGGAHEENEVTTELTKYISNIPETSLTLKNVISNINYDGTTLINTKPILDAIVKDTNISEQNLNEIISYLYDCINGKIPYEESKTILNNENVRYMLQPLLGMNYNFLENPILQNITGGKKHKKTRRKNNFSKNKKTLRKKYSGGQIQLELVNKYIQNEILFKELPVLFTLYLNNFELTIETQIEYLLKQTIQSFNSNDILENIETTNYLQLLMINYYSIESINNIYSDSKIIELNEGQEGGAKISEVIKATIISTVQNIYNLFTGSGGNGITITGIIVYIIPQIANALSGIGKVPFQFLWFLIKIILSIAQFVISILLSKYNLDGIIDNILPFISIYNYDYITTAIDTQQFYKDLISNPKFSLDKKVNTEGTTYAFPKKFIENIYYPYTPSQIKVMNKGFNDLLIKPSFQMNSINLSKEKNAKLTYDLNNKLNEISCGITNIIEDNIKLTLKDSYIEYKNDKLLSLKGEYEDNKIYNTGFQLGGIYISLEELSKNEYDSSSVTRLPINISGNFISIEKTEIEIGGKIFLDTQPPEEPIYETINSPIFTNLHSILNNMNQDIETKIKFLQKNPYKSQPYIGEQSKFENTLELLKIIRAGVVYHDSNFVYHPHYVLNTSTQGNFDNPTIGYYLPIVYPPTEDIMFSFCNFLTNKGCKYIWLNKYFDPLILDEQVKFGQMLTFPIKSFESEPDDNPICIVISPNHKEGFSFTYNPVLISLGLSETSGDEEQIYGRVLRKYGVDALDGKYDKKIYQYFSGGNKDTTTLPLLTSLYSLDNLTIFRGMYDSSGYNKTTAFGSTGVQLIDSILLSIFQTYDGIQFNNWISTDSSKTYLYRKTLDSKQKAEFDRLTDEEKDAEKERFIQENFPIIELNDELQLKLLYQIKYVCSEFFNKIAKKENATVKTSFGSYIWSFLDKNIKIGFAPIDLQLMRKSDVTPLTYCVENLKEPINDTNLYINEKLNITSALVCSNKGIVCPPSTGGYNKKNKITKKRKNYKKNNKTRKHKKII